jgi:hypothetical protein
MKGQATVSDMIMRACKVAAAAWSAVSGQVAAKTGLWRVNAWAWDREARQLEELAAMMAGVSGLADNADLLRALGRLRERARNLRRRAREARPS